MHHPQPKYLFKKQNPLSKIYDTDESETLPSDQQLISYKNLSKEKLISTKSEEDPFSSETEQFENYQMEVIESDENEPEPNQKRKKSKVIRIHSCSCNQIMLTNNNNNEKEKEKIHKSSSGKP